MCTCDRKGQIFMGKNQKNKPVFKWSHFCKLFQSTLVERLFRMHSLRNLARSIKVNNYVYAQGQISCGFNYITVMSNQIPRSVDGPKIYWIAMSYGSTTPVTLNTVMALYTFLAFYGIIMCYY